MSSHDKPPKTGVANWPQFLKNGLSMGHFMPGIIQNWMLQACSNFKLKKTGQPLLHQIFAYAGFRGDQLQAAIRLCHSESFLRQLPEPRCRMIRDGIANLSFEEELPEEEEFVICRRHTANSSQHEKSMTTRIECLEKSLSDAEEARREQHIRAIIAERHVALAEVRTREAEERARLTQMQAKQSEKQLADIKQVLLQLGQLFQSNEKPAMSPGSHSNGNSNGNPKNENPPDHLCDSYFSCELKTDPVFTNDGHTYERKSIEDWFAMGKQTSPATGAILCSLVLVKNYKLKEAIDEWVKTGGSGSVSVTGGVAAVGGGCAAVAVGGSDRVAAVGGGDRGWADFAWSNDNDSDD